MRCLRLISLPRYQFRFDHSKLEVIMYFIVYLCIQPGITHNAYGRFAVYFVCLVPHIHLTQAFVLKPRTNLRPHFWLDAKNKKSQKTYSGSRGDWRPITAFSKSCVKPLKSFTNCLSGSGVFCSNIVVTSCS
jgi:hypothetical protein